MKPTREELLNRSVDMGDGWVRMPYSDWGATMDFLRVLERIEEVMMNPFEAPETSDAVSLGPEGE